MSFDVLSKSGPALALGTNLGAARLNSVGTAAMMRKSDTQRPNCGHAMRLFRTVPKLGTLPKLQSFRCYSCSEVVTEAIEDG
jgi:hypothetical protein